MQRRLLLGLVMVLAAGCANLPPAPSVPLPGNLAALQRWQAHGRLGVSGPQNGGSGSFDWQQRGDQSEVQIRGPIGIGSVHLQLSGQDLTLETSDGQRLQSEAAWNELEARLGAPVPASNLRYWMLGLAAPGEHQWHENSGGAKTLEQDGWRIDYQRYSSEPGIRVPVKISATSGDARVRIVVDRWRLGQ